MGYAITDGKVFVTQQMKVTKEVWQWKKEKAAQGFFDSWKKSKKRSCSADGFKVVEVTPDKEMKASDKAGDDAVLDEYPSSLGSKALDFPEDIYADDCMKLFAEANDVIQRLEKRSEYLAKKLAETEREIEDLRHYIELAPGLNAPSGYKVYKMLRERLVTRRYCKDQLLLLGTVQKEGWEGNFYAIAKKQAKGLKDRTYSPLSHGEVAKLFDKL